VRAFKRAKLDEQQGDLGSARARLRSYLSSTGYDPAVCERIARISMKMQDPVEAGRWYFLCDSADADAAPAIERFCAAAGGEPRQIYGQLPAFYRRISRERLPGAVLERLKEIRALPPADARTRPPSDFFDWLIPLGCITMVALTLLFAAIGAIAMFRWLLHLLA
jgi:hypothetical protein